MIKVINKFDLHPCSLIRKIIRNTEGHVYRKNKSRNKSFYRCETSDKVTRKIKYLVEARLVAEPIPEKSYNYLKKFNFTKMITPYRISSYFTIIEVLIVIALFALLSSMIQPSLERAIKYARSIECLSNQKKLMLSHNFYSNDNADGIVSQLTNHTFLWQEGSLFNPWTMASKEELSRDGQEFWWKTHLTSPLEIYGSSIHSICPEWDERKYIGYGSTGERILIPENEKRSSSINRWQYWTTYAYPAGLWQWDLDKNPNVSSEYWSWHNNSTSLWLIKPAFHKVYDFPNPSKTSQIVDYGAWHTSSDFLFNYRDDNEWRNSQVIMNSGFLDLHAQPHFSSDFIGSPITSPLFDNNPNTPIYHLK